MAFAFLIQIYESSNLFLFCLITKRDYYEFPQFHQSCGRHHEDVIETPGDDLVKYFDLRDANYISMASTLNWNFHLFTWLPPPYFIEFPKLNAENWINTDFRHQKHYLFKEGIRSLKPFLCAFFVSFVAKSLSS